MLLYSSIVTPDNHKKGKAVGADAQVALAPLIKIALETSELAKFTGRESPTVIT